MVMNEQEKRELTEQQHLASDKMLCSSYKKNIESARLLCFLHSGFSLYSWIVYIFILMQMIIFIEQDIPDVGTLDVTKATVSLHTQESLQRESSLHTLSEISQL